MTGALAGALGVTAVNLVTAVADVPVDPSAPDARQWLREELAKAPYQAAKPTWFDRLSQAFFDWIGSLRLPGGDGLTGWVPVVVTVVVVAAIATAVLIFGLPRWNRRSRLAAEGLFQEDDLRSAADMRAAAAAAAARGDFALAIEEMFRAVARGLAERTVLVATPGMTAREVAARASAVFPAEQERLGASAVTFDEVRYLDRPGSEAGYRALAELEADLRSARPALPAAAPEPAR